MHRLWCLVVIGALAVAVSVVGAGPAVAAKGGNNDAANVCQHGGWKALRTFANQGDCINDGAQGSPVFGAAGNAACDAVNGLFHLNTDPTSSWSCTYDPGAHPDGNGALAGACNADTGNSGTFFNFIVNSVQTNSVCTTMHSEGFGAAGAAACAAIGGGFSLPSLGVWRCEYTPATDREPPSDASTLELSAACDQDTQGGPFFARPNSIRPDWLADCSASAPTQEILVADAGPFLNVTPPSFGADLAATAMVIGVDPDTGARTTVAGGELVEPDGMARAPDGDILVTDLTAFGGGGGVFRVDPATGAVTAVSANGAPAGGPAFSDPVGVAVEADGDILVADDGGFGGAGGVIRVDPATGARTALSANGAPPAPAGGVDFGDPRAVAVVPRPPRQQPPPSGGPPSQQPPPSGGPPSEQPPPSGGPPPGQPPVSGPQAGACANAKTGSAGPDTLTGTPFGDALRGLAGNDVLLGLAGDDCLSGGAGNDRLSGGSGNDRVSGGRGGDRLLGGRGNDRINPGPGPDRIDAGPGKDRINVQDRAHDRIDCGPGQRDLAIIDRFDTTRNCEHVRRR
jgi:Ca2+-binding RTX toxin-like protein